MSHKYFEKRILFKTKLKKDGNAQTPHKSSLWPILEAINLKVNRLLNDLFQLLSLFLRFFDIFIQNRGGIAPIESQTALSAFFD